MALLRAALQPRRVPLPNTPQLWLPRGYRAASMGGARRDPPPAALQQRANSLALQRALDADDHAGARVLLAQLLRDGTAQPHHVTSVLRRCSTREDVAGIAEGLDDPLRARLASNLHTAWVQHREFGLGAAALAHGGHPSKLTVSCSHSFSQSNRVPCVWMTRCALWSHAASSSIQDRGSDLTRDATATGTGGSATRVREGALESRGHRDTALCICGAVCGSA